MELRPVTLDDLPLYERQFLDPRMMAHLGGPWTADKIPDKLKRDVEAVAADEYWMFAIILGGDPAPAGTVCIWRHGEGDEVIDEIGWGVLPEYQGRGVGTAAVLAILEKARTAGRWGPIHAYPAVTNGPSNAICRKTGFTLVGEQDTDFVGHTFRCNHWVINLDPA